jgi:hypothetical protein
MALLMRVVTKPKWIRPAWMSPDDLPADVLTDLRASNNELSVWSTELDRSNIDAAIVAAASSRERIDKLDYTLFEEEALIPLGIKCVKSDGGTPHPLANGTMHRDLVQLTVHNVVHLAGMMMPLERMRVSEKQIRLMLLNALQNGDVERTRIGPKLLADLEGR